MPHIADQNKVGLQLTTLYCYLTTADRRTKLSDAVAKHLQGFLYTLMQREQFSSLEAYQTKVWLTSKVCCNCRFWRNLYL